MTSVNPGAAGWSFYDHTVSATDKVDAAALDTQVDTLWDKLNELLTALGVSIRDDNTLTDALVRLRNLHPEVALALATPTGWQPKAAVVCATTANITLSGEQTIDGVLTSGSRVLVKDQSISANNGIYVTGSGAWIRAVDADTAAEIGYALVSVSQGSTNKNTTWVAIAAPSSITLGSTSLGWALVWRTFDVVDNSQMANMAQATIKGRAAGVGTGAPMDLTPTLARLAMAPWDDVGALGYVNAKEPTYGAVGDGIADDTAALRNALAAAKAAGKDLWLPPGTYRMVGDGSYDEVTYGLLYLSSSQTGIVGAGRGTTIIKCGSATASGIRISGATKARVGGFTLDMNGSTGFGVYFGGQYSRLEDVEIKNIAGVRVNDTIISGIALVIPGSNLSAFNDITVLNCANGIYAGFSGSDSSAPCQYLTFNRVNMDPSRDGFSIRVKYGSTITFADTYVEGAPVRIIDLISSNGVYFRNLSAEIIGDYPLTTNSHFLSTACQNVKFDGVRILYSTGAPANKNLWELGGAGELFSLRDVLIHIRENIGEVIKTTATQDMVLLDGVYVKPVVGGKTCAAITTGAFYNINAKTIQGAPFKPIGTHVHVISAFCDVWVTPGATGSIHAEVGSTDWRIYSGGVDTAGVIFDYVPAGSNIVGQGGTMQSEYLQANSYFKFGNGITFKFTTAASPNGTITANPGSLCVSNNGGGGTLWLKASGTGNTGWSQIT